ncbi:MAG TPA: hypothetical protein VMQ46_10090 [Acidimicrobiia bacterium]|nr:hypothetical protein [Acidimicrobiia bacterium]
MASLDRRLLAVVVAGVIVVATTLIIVFIAIVPTPEFPPLQAGQQTGFVAYSVDGDGEAGPVRIVDLATTEVVVVDARREMELVGWDSDGNLVVVNWATGGQFALFDPATGEEVGTMDSDDGEKLFQEGQVFINRDDGNVTLEQLDGAGTASFTAPEAYDIGYAVSMGDDRIVFVDELGRLAVTYTGKDVAPVLVASDAVEWSRVVARP